MTRTIRYALMDPTGNTTLLAETPVDPAEQPACAARLMALEPRAEQVGFLSPGTGARIALRMAGGEFCGNAAMSAAALRAMDAGAAEGRFSVAVAGTDTPAAVTVTALPDGSFRCAAAMPRPLAARRERFPDGRSRPVVRFDGIAHVILESAPDRAAAEALAPVWCRALDARALGLMFWDRTADTLTPLVYVPGAGTLFWETSCASGTTAAGVWLAAETGGAVTVSLRQPGGVLTVAAAPDGAPTLTGTVRLLGRSAAEIDR